jgi:hypothetical protein
MIDDTLEIHFTSNLSHATLDLIQVTDPDYEVDLAHSLLRIVFRRGRV